MSDIFVSMQLMLTEDSTARKLVGSLNEHWAYKRFNSATIKIRISPESMAIIDGEFLRLKEFNEVKLNADIQDFLEDAHSSFTSKGALNPREPRFKRSLIHYAAMGDCSELLHFLLATGAARDDRDLNSRTPLSWAAEHGALKSVKILLEDGAEINSMDDMFSNAFVVAGTRGCSYATIGRHGSLSEAERCARVRCQAMLDPAEDQNALTDSQGQISSAQSFSDRPTNLTPPVIGVRWQSWSAGLDWKTVPSAPQANQSSRFHIGLPHNLILSESAVFSLTKYRPKFRP